MKVLSPAKINVFLYVTGRRADGYHNLASLMTCLDFYDEIEIEETVSRGTGISVDVSCDHPLVPEGKDNIAYKAAELFYNNFSLLNENGTCANDKGIKIHIDKKIPVGAGLGGGSSNAASVLKKLNDINGSPFSLEQLMEHGRMLGADVPFFIFEKSAIAQGIGEKLTGCGDLVPYHVLVCYPGVSASTVEVFKNFDIKLTEKRKLDIDTRLNIRDKAGRVDVAKYMHNDLEDTAFRLYPEIKHTKEEMELVLSERFCMTGSGSSLFAFFVDYKKAEKAYSVFAEKWRGGTKEVILTSFML